MERKAFAILVGGGPAPGINGVISAATIEAINRGHKVFGIRKGFELISNGDLSSAVELTIPDVSWIQNDGGSVLRTSRANPTKDPKTLQTVVSSLLELSVGYLVTIGGDDTASSSRAVAQVAKGAIKVAHVPKTIDNDLPLPSNYSTFGFQSAREVGTEIVESLMVDAKTTERWYLVVAMGRKAGHLALGIGTSASATMTVIPEELGEGSAPLSTLVNLLVGSILKRKAEGRQYGVVVLAEGLAEKLDAASIPELATAERDPHGNIRYSEVDFGAIIKNGVQRRLKELGVKLTVLDKNVGYELRCREPNAFDREYTRELGFGVVDFLLSGGTEAMISRVDAKLVPIPFDNFVDPQSGKARIRLVDINSDVYKVAKKYMIRLSPGDLENAERLCQIAEQTNLSPEKFKEEFSAVASQFGVAKCN